MLTSQHKSSYTFAYVDARDQGDLISKLLVYLAHAKIKTLLDPRYQAKEQGWSAELGFENGVVIRHAPVRTLGWVDAQVTYHNEVPQGLSGQLKLYQGAELLFLCPIISLGAAWGLLSFQLELDTLEQKRALGGLISRCRQSEQAIKDEVTTPPEPSENIEKNYASLQEFLVDALSFDHERTLSISYPHAVKAGCVANVVLSVTEGFHQNKLSFLATLVSTEPGVLTVASSHLRHELKQFLENLTQGVCEQASQKIFQKRKEELLSGKWPELAPVSALPTKIEASSKEKTLPPISSPSGAFQTSYPPSPVPRSPGRSPRQSVPMSRQATLAIHRSQEETLRLRFLPFWYGALICASFVGVYSAALHFSKPHIISPKPEIHFRSALR